MGSIYFSQPIYYIETKRIIIHPLYYNEDKSTNLLYNIALLELPQSLPLNNDNIQAIQLPSLHHEYRTFENWLATVSGFGSKCKIYYI